MNILLYNSFLSRMFGMVFIFIFFVKIVEKYVLVRRLTGYSNFACKNGLFVIG